MAMVAGYGLALSTLILYQGQGHGRRRRAGPCSLSSPSSSSLSSSSSCCGFGNSSLVKKRDQLRFARHSLLFSPSRGRDKRTLARALGFDSETMLLTIIGSTSVLSFCALRIWIYFRIQYIIAAMVGNNVPRGGVKVLELNAHEGRNFYYYPTDVKEVVAVAKENEFELLKNQALRAGVLLDVRSKLLAIPSNSMDVVVSVYCLCDLTEKEVEKTISEAARVLKPGKPLIFVENIAAEGSIVYSAQALLQNAMGVFGMQSNLTRSATTYLKAMKGFEEPKYEVIMAFQDPHIVGIATKQLAPVGSKSSKRARQET